MKKFLIFLVLAVFSTDQYNSQIPIESYPINYQAVARTSAGDLLSSTDLTVTISIFEGALASDLVYSETHDLTTNIYGLFNLQIGDGVQVSTATFEDVCWKPEEHWIEVSILNISTGSLSVLPKERFLSVPYAHVANCADSASHAIYADTAIFVLNDRINNLDEAYDKGGPGIGRKINVDAEAVLLEATDHNALHIKPDTGYAGVLIETVAGAGHGLRIISQGIDAKGIQADLNGGIGAEINADGQAKGIEVNHLDGTGIDIDGSAHSVSLSISNPTGGKSIEVINAGDSTNIEVISSGNADAISIQNSSGGAGVRLIHGTVSNGVHVNNSNGTEIGLNGEGGNAGYFNNSNTSNNTPTVKSLNGGNSHGVMGVQTPSEDDMDNAIYFSSENSPPSGVAGYSTSNRRHSGVLGLSRNSSGVLGETFATGEFFDGPDSLFGAVTGRAKQFGESGNSENNNQMFGVAGVAEIGGAGVIGTSQSNGYGVIGITKGVSSTGSHAGVWGVVEELSWQEHRALYPFQGDLHEKGRVGVLGQGKQSTGVWGESSEGIGVIATTGQFNDLANDIAEMNEVTVITEGGATEPTESDKIEHAALVARSDDATSYTGVFKSAEETNKPTLYIESKTKRNVGSSNGSIPTGAVQVANQGTGSGLRVVNFAVESMGGTDGEEVVVGTAEAARFVQNRPGKAVIAEIDNPEATEGSNVVHASTNGQNGSAGYFAIEPASGGTNTLFEQNDDPALKASHKGVGNVAHFETLNAESSRSTLYAKGKSLNTVAEFTNTSLQKPVMDVSQEGLGGGATIAVSNVLNEDTTLAVLNNGKGYSLLVNGSNPLQDSLAVFRYNGSPTLGGPPAFDPYSWESIENLIDYVANDLGDKNGRVAAFIQDVNGIGNQIATEECVLIESNVGELFSLPDVNPFTPVAKWSLVNPFISWNKWADPHYALKVNSFNAAQFNGNVDINQGLQAGYVDLGGLIGFMETEPVRWSHANFGTKEGPAAYFELTPNTGLEKNIPAILAVNYDSGSGGIFAVGDSLNEDEIEIGKVAMGAFYKKPSADEESEGTMYNSALLSLENSSAGLFETGKNHGFTEPTIISQNRSSGIASAFVLGDSLSSSDYGTIPSSMYGAYKAHDPGTVDDLIPKHVYNEVRLNIKEGSAGYFDVSPAQYAKPLPTLINQNRADGHAGIFIVGDSLEFHDFADIPQASYIGMWQKESAMPIDPMDVEEPYSTTVLNQADGPAGYFGIPGHEMFGVPALHASNQSGGAGGLFTVGLPIEDYSMVMPESVALIAGHRASEDPTFEYYNKAHLGIEFGPAAYFETTMAEDLIDPKEEPTVAIVNSAAGNAGYLVTTEPENEKSTLLLENYGSGPGLQVDTYSPDAYSNLNLLRELPSEDGDPETGRIATFYLDAPTTDVDCAVDIFTSSTSPGHSALQLTAIGEGVKAIDAKGNVEIEGDMLFSDGYTVNMGVGGTIIAGSGGLVDATTIVAGSTSTDALTVTGSGSISGDLHVTGTLSKGSGTFKIDHPLDPYNKYLYHSFVESPDMMNIYNGNIVTNKEGYAIVSMPDYFNALNVEFRYQLTVIGAFAQAIVLEEIDDNQFVIQTDEPNVKVSWQVTGVRNDAFARENRVVPEVDKEAENVGTLLYEPAIIK